MRDDTSSERGAYDEDDDDADAGDVNDNIIKG